VATGTAPTNTTPQTYALARFLAAFFNRRFDTELKNTHGAGQMMSLVIEYRRSHGRLFHKGSVLLGRAVHLGHSLADLRNAAAVHSPFA